MLLLYLRTIRPIASFSFYYVTTYIRTGPFPWSLDIPCWILDIRSTFEVERFARRSFSEGWLDVERSSF